MTLTVTDESGDSAVDTVRVVVGNQRPIITFEYPENGKIADFGDRIRYKLNVVDPDGGTVPCAQVRLEFKLGHDSHAHELSNATGCEGEFTLTGVDGHGVDANIFTVITANYTDAGNGPAAPVTGSAEVILQPKLKQAEYFATTGRTADSRGTGDPGVTTETTTDVGGGLSAAFIEDGDWISFNPYNLEELNKVTFRVASGGAGGIIELRYDAADGPLVAATPNIAPTGGWQTWRDVTIDLPTTIPQGTHRLFVVFRHPTATGSLMNLNYFKFVGKGAAVTAPPEVTATAEPLTGTAPLNVAFNATATDAENEALTYAWDFGVPGTGTDTSTQEDPNYTYTSPGNYTATVTVTDASGGKVVGHRGGPRHAAARRVPDRPGPLGRVRRHGAGSQPLDRGAARRGQPVERCPTAISTCRSPTARSTGPACRRRTWSSRTCPTASGWRPRRSRSPPSTRTTSRPACACTRTTTTGRPCT